MSSAVQINNKKHLWQPGQSGNPLGRSIRKYSVINKCKDLLGGVHNDKYTAEKLAALYMKRLFSAKTTPTVFVQMVALLWQYTETKPVERIEIVQDKRKIECEGLLHYVKAKMAEAGAEIPPDWMLIDKIATTAGWEDARECLADLYEAGRVEG